MRDDTDAVLAAIEDAAATADLLVTSGGVSMGGEHDVVKAALQRLGAVRFTKVAMQPGMPQGFGTIGENAVPLFTLPGNPVSAYRLVSAVCQAGADALQDLEPRTIAGCPCRAHGVGPITGGKAFFPARDSRS